MRAIPLARSARRRLKLEPPVIDPSGTLDARDTAAARRVAARLNAERLGPSSAAVPASTASDPSVGPPAGNRRPGAIPGGASPAAVGSPAEGSAALPRVGAGDLVALAALNAVLHQLVEQERRTGAVDLGSAIRSTEERLGPSAPRAVASAWLDEFRPTTPEVPEPRDADVAAELLVLAALNDNPAVEPLRELVDDRPLRQSTPYEAVVDALERTLGGKDLRGRGATRAPAAGAAGGRGGSADLPLPARLREPFRHAPASLQAQLRWIRDHWPEVLAADPGLAERVALAIDILAEEGRALELAAAARAVTFGGAAGAEAPDYRGLDAEPEAFSADTEWMPSVVLLAKSTYVWLEQLSKRYGRSISNLASVPDEELDRLAAEGVTGLWLIGLWQRSRASAEIKRRRGDQDAVASAYSVDDYVIADDLGGEPAFDDLKARAAVRGIRMAADMVPNHMGIDSRWVIEHPERFISLEAPPFPSYSFGGPNLSDDPDVEITLEDHYWDNSDAAVVFRRRQVGGSTLAGIAPGDERFIYHGNDGTSFPWNDTAQLDYLQADVREAVIRTILDVARRAPIIRFDAAMVLARRHIRRLWYPKPGEGGAIPSRAEHALSDAEFNRRMPTEFWREVVDRVAADAPGTLLLAEAFWLLEGYFVRTLGMHRVYNSAFMHMLRDEDNAGYRRVMKDTLEFDPRVLQRFVNFMTNPDERPAAEQFGTADKAFAVATLLATLPGLPMVGHGQVEGFRERYGMEFRRARWDEPLDQPHVDHWNRTIAPLLRRRSEFAGAERFHLYDASADDGSIVEDVYALSNGAGARRSLVLVHNRQADVDVTIDRSAAARPAGGGGRLSRTRLAADLDLPNDDTPMRFRDPRTGWETTRPGHEVRERGLHVHLGPYEAVVLDVEVAPAVLREVGMGAEALAPTAASRLTLDDLPEPARAAATRYLATLREVLGDDLVAAWVHGGTTFPDRSRRPGDLDLAGVVRNIAPRERVPSRWLKDPASRPARLRAARRAIHDELGIEIDQTFVLVDDVGLGRAPRAAFVRRAPVLDWPVMRAHWLAGQYVPLAGPPPESFVKPPTERELRRALDRELEHLERHVAEGDAEDAYEATYAIWNGARILHTLATGNPVISKRSAGTWALEALPERWHPAIRAAGRAYDGEASDEDRRILRESMAPFVAMVRAELGSSAGRSGSKPRWS
jgi:glycosidase